MPKGKATPEAAKSNATAVTVKTTRKEARRQAQDKREAANRLADEPSPWQYSKALRAERRRGLPMSTETRKRLDREKRAESTGAERESDAKNRSSKSQARRNGAAADSRPDKTPQPIAAV